MNAIELPSVRKYEIPAWSKLGGWLWIIGLGGIAIACAIWIFIDLMDKTYTSLILGVPGLLITGIGAYAQLDGTTSSLKIEPDRIIYSSLIKRTEIQFQDVKGYSFIFQRDKYSHSNLIGIHHKEYGRVIDFNENCNNKTELKNWLVKHFKDVSIDNYLT